MTSGYQRAVRALVRYADGPERLGHLALELASEAGEVANEIKKVYRDDGGRLSPERRARLLDELGDVLWAAVALIDACDGDEGQVRRANVIKLTRRMAERGHLAPDEAAAIARLMEQG